MTKEGPRQMLDRLETIQALPTPEAAPQMSLTRAGIGLSFLQTALRQNHTRRLTEDLVFGASERSNG